MAKITVTVSVEVEHGGVAESFKSTHSDVYRAGGPQFYAGDIRDALASMSRALDDTLTSRYGDEPTNRAAS